jgi:hypothetical protein
MERIFIGQRINNIIKENKKKKRFIYITMVQKKCSLHNLVALETPYMLLKCIPPTPYHQKAYIKVFIEI